jgi:hypothetical protein
MALIITDANAREAAAAAERLLGDLYLRETLDELVAINTRVAMTGLTAAEREDGRQMVLAIDRLRATLTAVFEHWRGAAAVLQQAQSHE